MVVCGVVIVVSCVVLFLLCVCVCDLFSSYRNGLGLTSTRAHTRPELVRELGQGHWGLAPWVSWWERVGLYKIWFHVKASVHE